MLKECNAFEILAEDDLGLRICLYIIVNEVIPSRRTKRGGGGVGAADQRSDSVLLHQFVNR
jgi:hypothetical protein